VLIGAERAERLLDDVIGDDDDVVIAAITAAELLVGVELAGSRNRKPRQSFVDTVLTTVPTKPYDLDVARVHASLLAHPHRSGRPRGAHDLLIAATALAHGRAVVTADPAGFAALPGVALRSAFS
jgi:tRNA(fMet)-specific endonuclease VapC